MTDIQAQNRLRTGSLLTAGGSALTQTLITKGARIAKWVALRRYMRVMQAR